MTKTKLLQCTHRQPVFCESLEQLHDTRTCKNPIGYMMERKKGEVIKTEYICKFAKEMG